MKQIYCIPFITSLDSCKVHLFRNQTTCDPNILNGQTLNITDFGNFCGEVEDLTEIEICMNGSEDISAQLVGLIVNTLGGQQFQITGCTAFLNDCGPGTVFYECSGTGTLTGNLCIESIACSDGTILTTCPDFSACLNGS
jgi:hypothetical protein